VTALLLTPANFVANHVLRAESLLSQADRAVAQFRKSGTGSVGSWRRG
jgi:hypothetical protein